MASHNYEQSTTSLHLIYSPCSPLYEVRSVDALAGGSPEHLLLGVTAGHQHASKQGHLKGRLLRVTTIDKYYMYYIYNKYIESPFCGYYKVYPRI